MRRQLHQRGGHFVDGAVTAAGDDGADAELCGFRDVARGVAVLPVTRTYSVICSARRRLTA